MLYSCYGAVAWGAAAFSHLHVAPYLCRNAFSTSIISSSPLDGTHTTPAAAAAIANTLLHMACVAFATPVLSIAPCSMLFVGFVYWHSHATRSSSKGDCTKLLRFKNPYAQKRFQGRRIDMETLYEMYFDGQIDFNVAKEDENGLPMQEGKEPCLLRDVLSRRHEFVDYTFGLTTHLRFLLFKWVPDVLSHSKHQDTDQVRDHYDRSKSYDNKAEDDFFGMFLGPKMVYTSGVSSECNGSETLEQLQDNKLKLICRFVFVVLHIISAFASDANH